MQPLAANLEALRRTQPALAERMTDAEPDRNGEIFAARSGAVSVRLDGSEEASAEDPEAEARQLAAYFVERAREAGATRLVLFGMGVHTLRFLGDFDGPILVAEPSERLLRAVLARIDLSQALERIQLVAGEDSGQILQHPIFTSSERGLLLAHPSSRRRFPAFHDLLAQRFRPGGAPCSLDIAVIPPLYGGAVPVAAACGRALLELGHHVRMLDLAAFWPAYQEVLRISTDQRFVPLSESLRAGLVRVIGEMLLGSFRLDPPDLVFAVAGAPLDPQALRSLGQLGVTRALWFCEDAHVMSYWSELTDLYDTIFHLQPDALAEPLRQAGAYAAELPMGFDPSLHRPIALSSEERTRYGCDTSFVGAGYHNRRHFLPALFSLGLRIYGTDWPLSEAFLDAMPEPNVRLSSEDSNRIFNLEINGNRQLVDPPSTDELRELLQRSLGPGHLIQKLVVNGRAIDEDQLEAVDVESVRSVSVGSATPQTIARNSLGEASDWIARIGGVLESVSEDFRVGKDQNGRARLVDVIEALQVLVSLLQGLRRFLEVEPDQKSRVRQPLDELPKRHCSKASRICSMSSRAATPSDSPISQATCSRAL